MKFHLSLHFNQGYSYETCAISSETRPSHREVELKSVLQQQETFQTSEIVSCLLPVWISRHGNEPDRLAPAQHR